MSEQNPYIYLPIPTKKPIPLRGTTPLHTAIGIALIDFPHAYDQIAFNHHCQDHQHLIFMDDYALLGRSSTSSRLHSQSHHTSSELHDTARTLQQRIRPASGMRINVTLSRLDGSDQRYLEDLATDGTQFCFENSWSIFGSKTTIVAEGPIPQVIPIHKYLTHRKIKSYQVTVY